MGLAQGLWTLLAQATPQHTAHAGQPGESARSFLLAAANHHET